MFFSALDRTRRGVVACVFDTTDRVQHMFFAQKDKGGPYSKIIEDLYRRADELVGKMAKYVDSETVLFVLSDHGFASFERGCDLNAWLRDNGYLVLKAGCDGRRAICGTSIGAARAPTRSGWPACTSTRRAAKRRAS